MNHQANWRLGPTLSHSTTLFDPRKAEQVARKMQHNDPDWEYRVVHDPTGRGKSFIEIFDEDGKSVGKVASGREAGLLEAPPAMVRDITEWVQAVVAKGQLANRGNDLAYLESYLRPGTPAMPLGKKPLIRSFPLNLAGWRYAQSALVKSLKRLPSEWKAIRVALAWAASSMDSKMGGWDPRARVLTIKVRFKQDLDKLEPLIRHELEHVAQSFLGSLRGDSVGSTSPRPGMPSRKDMTPGHSQVGLIYDNNLSYSENYLLDDAEFYPQLSDMIQQTQQHLNAVSADVRYQQDYLRKVLSGAEFGPMQVWKKLAPGKWRKAVKEFSRAFPVLGGRRVASKQDTRQANRVVLRYLTAGKRPSFREYQGKSRAWLLAEESRVALSLKGGYGANEIRPKNWAPQFVTDPKKAEEGYDRIYDLERRLKRHPWQRTQAQVRGVMGMPAHRHQEAVERALRDGEDVPADVLQDYPDIKTAAKYAKSKFQNKKEVPKAEGSGTTTVYEYSEKQIQNRNREKAKRIEKLRGNLHKLQSKVKADLKSKDTHTRLCALAVGLMNDTYERVGNDESAKDGHVGVTGWTPEHIKFGDGKATITYVGKSGVKQEKVTKDADLIRVMKEAVKDKTKGDTIFAYEDGTVDAPAVNEYLDGLNLGITAKDIRGLHANREMQERLKAVRSKGGTLPTDKKKRDKKLKDEFQEALDGAAEAVGHEPPTLKSQYLVPGLEDAYVRDGTVLTKLHEKKSTLYGCIIRRIAARHLASLGRPLWATKTPAQKEDKDIRQMLKPDPKKKPPREDLRRNRMRTKDHDLGGLGAEGDKDLSLNFKKVAADLLADRWLRHLIAAEDPEHKPGDVWQNTDRKWVGKNPEGNVHTFGDTSDAKEQADAFAKGGEADTKKERTPEQEKGDNRRRMRTQLKVNRKKLDEQFDDIVGKLPKGTAAKLKTLMGKADDSDALKEAEQAVEEAQANVDRVEEDMDQDKVDDLEDRLRKAKRDSGGGRGDFGDFEDDDDKAEPSGNADVKALQKELDTLMEPLREAQAQLKNVSSAAQRAKRKETKGSSEAKEKFLNDVAAALDEAEADAVEALSDGVTSGMMEDAIKDPFAKVDWTDASAIAKALVQQNVNDKVLLNPAHVGGKVLSDSALDENGLTDRAETSFNQYRKGKADLRKKAAENAAEQLGELDPDSPQAQEMNRIIDGIHLAMEMNGEQWSVSGPDGKLLREPLDEKQGLLLKQMVHQGDARLLLTDVEDHAKNRDAIRDAMGRLSDGDLQELSKDTPWSPIGDLLSGPDARGLDPEVVELLRSLVRDMGINNMTINQGLVNAVAGKKMPASNPLGVYAKFNKQFKDKVQSSLDPAVSRWLDCITAGKGTESCAVTDLAQLHIDAMAKALDEVAKETDTEIDAQNPIVVAVRHAVKNRDRSILDETLKPEKPLAQQKEDYLKEHPEDRERVSKMGPDEFREMQNAVLRGKTDS